MKRILFFAAVLLSSQAYSQIPEDAIRYSWYHQNGSTRINSVGGTMGSLAGDITSIYVNPAGLAFFNTREVSFGINTSELRTRGLYRDSTTRSNKSVIGLNPVGVIIGLGKKKGDKESMTIGFAINQTVSFKNIIHLNGLNNYSSFSEQFAEEFAKSGLSIDQVLQTNSPLPYTSATALYTYLIDTVRMPDGSYQIKAAPEYLLDAGQALRQDYLQTSGGGIYELAASIAGNTDNKWYYGVTLGIPIVHYTSNTVMTETDTSTNADNHFKSFRYEDDFQTTGAGINLKAGAIYRPKDYFRIGLAIHSPSFMFLKDTRSIKLSTELESPTGSFNVSSNEFTNGTEGEASYHQYSPWKALVSASYVFREVQNVNKQRAFISADIEYVNHRGTKFRSNNEEPTADEKAYYKALTKVVKQQYKGAFNFRVGGEVKFSIIMARLGFAYYGDPYKNNPEKAYQMAFSGGLGYRDKGVFFDLGYVHHLKKDSHFPYRLEDRENTYGSLKQTRGTIMATFGFKF
ncbi:hypothetical protein EON80_01305 [bacterium]|nr:MAG: hypothetical protein EON80_01305 [bacterium]